MYKTSKVIIQNNIESIDPLTEYIKSIANIVGLNNKEKQKICYAVEESLQNSILFDFEPDTLEDIEIEITYIASGMKIVISDNGIPKNELKKSNQTIDDIVIDISFESIAKNNGDEISALSDFVIHKLLDKYRYINKGKDGRSIEMIIYASEDRIKDTSLEFQNKIQEQEQFTLIRTPTFSDITGISRLFYKSYGYSYVNDLVYFPDRLESEVKENRLISKVAISDNDTVIGHIALMQAFKNAKISEWGMAISDPNLRGQGIMTQLITEIMNYAKSSTFCGIFSHSVTNHEFTQKICTKYAFSDVALLVGYAGSDISFKNINNSLSQRESTIISYIQLEELSEVELFLPLNHQEMIMELYKGIGINIVQKNLSKIPNIPDTTKAIDTIIPALNIAEVILENIGLDAFETLKYITKKYSIAKIDIIYLYINLEDENSISLVKKLESFGYLFAGIFPYYHHNHTLVLQYINNLKFDYNLINSYTPLAKKLKSYIQALDNNQIDIKDSL